MTYNHKEAFCLMWYTCTHCKHTERIWNSRNGVTPFGAACPSCDTGSIQHMRWDLDEPTPDHVLRIGQKFWRDGTPDEAEAITRRRIDKLKGTKYEPNAKTADFLITSARTGDVDSEFRPGWPMLDVKVRA